MSKKLEIDREEFLAFARVYPEVMQTFKKLWPEEFGVEVPRLHTERIGGDQFLMADIPYGPILCIDSNGRLHRCYGCKVPGIQTDEQGRILLDEEP